MFARALLAIALSLAWPTYGANYANTRYFPAQQIRPENVNKLKLAWKFSTGEYGVSETSPIVIGDTLYATTGQTNTVFALDARTGTERWRYKPVVGLTHDVGEYNRGVAVAGGRVFFATRDGQLIALDAATGKPLWNTRIGDPTKGLSETMAPLAWNGLVFIGSSGGEFGIRGFITAYSQHDGHLVWRWYSVSPGWEGHFVASVDGLSLHRNIARERALAPRHRNAWQHGGGPVWMTPALDPRQGVLYLATGNPGGNYNGDSRPGDNLYTDSIVALDGRTGRMQWYYQETPHDLWDYDAASPPVLFDATDAHGRRVPAVGQAGKTGWLYIVDRRSGRLIRRSQAFVPQINMYLPPTRAGVTIEPGAVGGAIMPTAYDPRLRALFVTASALPEKLTSGDDARWPGGREEWQLSGADWPTNGYGLYSRIDVDTGRVIWQYRAPAPISGGALATGGLFFATETVDGFLDALDARTGKLLWHVKPADMTVPASSLAERLRELAGDLAAIPGRLWDRLVRQPDVTSDTQAHAPPVAYEVDGKEYIAVAADLGYSATHPNEGDAICAFSL